MVDNNNKSYMKTFFTSMILFAFTLMANAADYTALDKNAANVLYIEAKVQTNQKGVLNVYMKSNTTIGTVDFQFFMPEGFTLINSEDEKAQSVVGTYSIYPNQPDGSIKNAISGMTWAASDTPKLLATIPVNVTAGVGTYNINAIQYQMVKMDASEASLVNNVYTQVIVQRTEDITPQRSDYSLEALPFAVAGGETTMNIPVNFKSSGYVRNIEFAIEYPTGMLTSKSGKKYSITVDKSRFDTGNDASLTVAATNGTNVTFTNPEADLIKANTSGNLFNIPVTLTNVENGIYTIKFKNIKVYVTNDEADDLSTESLPDYNFTVFVGNSTENTDPILYGHYTTGAVTALATNADVIAMLKNVATIDATATNTDLVAAEAIGKMCEGKLLYSTIMGQTTTAMYRSSTNWSSICVPFEVSSNSSVQYYTISNTVNDGIILKEAASIPANTPAFCKAKAAYTLKKVGYIMPESTVDGAYAGGLTTKGTYSTINVAGDAGYYLSNNKFYNDGATVRPFRAYLEGSLAGAKELHIFLEEATGLRDITSEFSKEDIFNLQGIKMGNTQKGAVNIVNGKKILVK